jgi:hypothetical protein
MSIPTKQAALVAEVEMPEPAIPAVQVERAVSMFERLAKDATVDVDKLERLMAMQERIMAINRKAAFDASFARMQPEIPVIDEHGRIEVKGTVRSTYAPLEDIHAVIKPITAKFGFAIRHRTEWPADKPGIIRIIGILSHEQGHSEETIFEAPMDRSDYRTDIQSMGSTVSYGRRYTTLDLLNISTRKADNDGQRRNQSVESAEAPAGYADWITDMSACADEGWPKLSQAFSKSKPEFRNHATRNDKVTWDRLKDKAEQITKAAKS